MTHFIWELINSHATYVWSIPQDATEEPLRVIENEVKIIAAQGRQVYKSGFQSSETLFFTALSHSASTYSYEQYFARWKKNLDCLMI